MAFLTIPLSPHHHPHQPRNRVLHRHPHRHTIATATLNEVSKPLDTPPLPAQVLPTTLYHILPCEVDHLTPAIHPSDNHTLILSVSFRTPWLRTRYPRTKPFLRELRAGKRLYRGLHGTPGASGFNAPTKPRNVPTTIHTTAKSVVVAGTGLPYKHSPRDLVTFGETALGDVLTDSEALDQRGTELVARTRANGMDWFLTTARNSFGTVLRSFVATGARPTRRVATLNGFEARGIAVSDDIVVVLGWKSASVGGVGGLVRGLFGGSETSPSVDVEAGSDVVVLDHDGRVLCRVGVEGVLTDPEVSGRGGSGVVVTARRVTGEKVTLTTLEDVRSADAFLGEAAVDASIVAFEIDDKGTVSTPRRIGAEGVSAMDVARIHDSQLPHANVYIGFNNQSKRIGLWDTNGANWEAEQGERLSGVVYSPDHKYISALLTGATTPAKILLFDAADIAAGTIAEVVLEGVGKLGTSIDAVWTEWDFEFTEDNAKIVKSAYELFAEKQWNDIESGFSSLGLRF